MHAENVSISWLTEGVGAPYLVRWFPTDEECREYLDELLAFQDNWTVHRLTDGGRIEVLVLHTPSEKEYRKKKVVYTDLHVLAGAGRATLARVAQLPEHRRTLADTETVAAVAAGERAGTWELLGDGGLLREYETVTRDTLRVAENESPHYTQEADAISAEERNLVEIHRRLDPDHRVRWREVGDAFATAQRVRDDDDRENDSG